jgi:hypothetical protein
MKNRILAIPAAATAIPPNPNMAAMIAMMKNANAQRSIWPPRETPTGARPRFTLTFTRGVAWPQYTVFRIFARDLRYLGAICTWKLEQAAQMRKSELNRWVDSATHLIYRSLFANPSFSKGACAAISHRWPGAHGVRVQESPEKVTGWQG